MVGRAAGDGIPEGDKHRLWLEAGLLLTAEPWGRAWKGGSRLGAGVSIGGCAGFILLCCAFSLWGVISWMILGSSEVRDLALNSTESHGEKDVPFSMIHQS